MTEGGDELAAVRDEPVYDENENKDEPAGDGEQTLCPCRGVGPPRSVRRGGPWAGVKHEDPSE